MGSLSFVAQERAGEADNKSRGKRHPNSGDVNLYAMVPEARRRLRSAGV